jgi:hypothetical protein
MFSQDEAEPKYRMLEDVFIKVKPGSAADFEAAVLKHNEMFHKDGPYEAELYKIITGKDVGTYVWEMGSFTYSDLDGRPTAADGHDTDWDENVGKHIYKVTNVEYIRYNKKLSYAKKGEDHDMYQIWFYDIKDNNWDMWRGFMEKVQKINAKMDDSFSVWMNQYSQNDGRRISMAFGFDKWSDLDVDDWDMDDEFDKEFGEGAWDKALKDWDASTTEVMREVWVKVK